MTIPQSHLFLSSFIHTVHLMTSCRCPRSNYSKPVPILMHFVPPALFHSFNTSLVKLFPSLLYSKFRLLIPEAAPFIFVGRRRTILQATSAGAISGDQSTIILILQPCGRATATACFLQGHLPCLALLWPSTTSDLFQLTILIIFYISFPFNLYQLHLFLFFCIGSNSIYFTLHAVSLSPSSVHRIPIASVSLLQGSSMYCGVRKWQGGRLVKVVHHCSCISCMLCNNDCNYLGHRYLFVYTSEPLSGNFNVNMQLFYIPL